ncbi:MAG: glucoamylase family protein [Bacteroidota bacterium]
MKLKNCLTRKVSLIFVNYLGCISLCLVFLGNCFAQPIQPTGLEAVAYDSHIELGWDRSPESNLSNYRIYFSEDKGESFNLLQTINANNNSTIDFVGAHDIKRTYRIESINNRGQTSMFSDTTSATTFMMTDDELLTMVQEYTFRYFWDFAHPVSGLARERNRTSTVTTGGSGFGIMAILVGIERGFITREEGLTRMIKIVNFLTDKADRFQGVFSHWLNGATGTVIPFSRRDNGGDLVETAFLLEGLLTTREYFEGDNEQEIDLRNKITAIWEAVDFNWYRKNDQDVLWWHWSPQFDFEINLQLRGYHEALITYVLAVASPTNAVPASLYHTGWAGRANYTNGNSWFGHQLLVGPTLGGPLFFSHYSFLGLDPRGIKDDYANYFINGRNHTLMNRGYCEANPRDFVGYSDVCWGLTASDNPFGYNAHSPTNDNGTITPTAALSSFPYTPEESMAALKHFYRNLGDRLWGIYGFYDAFNLTENWFATSYLAIDQGPIICMIENHRTELLWKYFMKNPEITDALDAIGFVPDSTIVTNTENILEANIEFDVFPNPATENIQIKLNFPITSSAQLTIFDSKGQLLFAEKLENAKSYNHSINTNHLQTGVYYLKMESAIGNHTKRFIITK